MGLFLLAVLIILGGLFVAFIASARQNRQEPGVEDFPSLSFDSQILYRPIRSLRKSILETVQSSEDPATHAMAGSVIEEINSAHDRIVLALQTRDQLRNASEGHISAQADLDRMLKAREAAESPAEKLSFTRAYEAKLNEVAEYEKAKTIIKKIENEIELTKASLSEFKAKLSLSEASVNATERAEDLRTTLGSLETIQSSVDEAQVMLRS
jgi:phage shock protein A